MDSWFCEDGDEYIISLEDIKETQTNPQTHQEPGTSGTHERVGHARKVGPQLSSINTTSTPSLSLKGKAISSRHYSLEKKLMMRTTAQPPLSPRHYSLESFHTMKTNMRDSGFDSPSSHFVPLQRQAEPLQDEYIEMQSTSSIISGQNQSGDFREDASNLTKLKSTKSMELLTSDVIDEITEFTLEPSAKQNLPVSPQYASVYDYPMYPSMKESEPGATPSDSVELRKKKEEPPKIPVRFSSLDAYDTVPDHVLYQQGKRLSALLGQDGDQNSGGHGKSKIKSALNKVIKSRKISLPALTYAQKVGTNKPPTQSTLVIPKVPKRKKISVDMISAPIITKCPSMECVSSDSAKNESKSSLLAVPGERERSHSLVQLDVDSEYVKMHPQRHNSSLNDLSTVSQATIGTIPPSASPSPPPPPVPASASQWGDSCLESRVIPPFQVSIGEPDVPVYANEHTLTKPSPAKVPSQLSQNPPQRKSAAPPPPPQKPLQLSQKPFSSYHYQRPTLVPHPPSFPPPPLCSFTSPFLPAYLPPSLPPPFASALCPCPSLLPSHRPSHRPSLPPSIPPSLSPSHPPPLPPPRPIQFNTSQFHPPTNASSTSKDAKPLRSRKKPILPPNPETIKKISTVESPHIKQAKATNPSEVVSSVAQEEDKSSHSMIDLSQLLSAKEKLKKKPPPPCVPYRPVRSNRKMSQPLIHDASKSSAILKKISEPLLPVRKSQSVDNILAL